MKYRSDIDGLRAVAVLPVLLYHAGLPSFPGGYVGVDIFFVISGYLITGIILDEVDAGRFSILAFYERRVRRILPALFVVLLFTLAAAYWLFLPSNFKEVGSSVIATVFFLSNVFFFAKADYFDTSAIEKPLLHTWSLGVEEQFYIVFPVAIFLIHAFGWKRARSKLLAAAALVSLAGAAVAIRDHQAFVFYMLPFRAWELLAGSLLACGAVKAVSSAAARETLALLGLALILYAVFVFSHDTLFPGINALPPVLGAALLIHTAPGTIVGRALSWRPLVWVGLISYSLYLWHWPLIVFVTYYLQAPMEPALQAAVIAASVMLAALSYRFIETPFRRARGISRLQLFSTSGVLAAALVAAAAVPVATSGLPDRFPRNIQQMINLTDAISPRRNECHSPQDKPIAPEASCLFGSAGVDPAFALWGDSHGVELAYVLGDLAARHNQSLLQMTSSSCPPSLGFRIASRPGCQERNEAVLQYILGRPSIETVFLVSYFGERYPPDSNFLPGLAEAARKLIEAGKRVVVVGPTPNYEYNVPNRLALASLRGDADASLGLSRSAFVEEQRPAIEAINAIKASGVAVLWPHDILCPETRCRIAVNGVPLYFDDHHLSVAGARLIEGLFSPYFQGPYFQGPHFQGE